MSKPLHPATVHWPISFLSLSYALDLVYFSSTSPSGLIPLPASISKTLTPQLPLIAQGSHYLLSLGILTGLVSIVSGGSQLVQMISKAGLYETYTSEQGKQEQRLRPKIKTALTHASINDFAIVLSVYSWWVRRESGAGGWQVALAPTTANVLVAAVGLPATLYAAALGGSLVYNHGVGLQLGGGKKKE